MQKETVGHPLWVVAVVATVGGVVANLLVLLLTKPLAPDFLSLTAFPVIFWTVIAGVGASVVFALTRKYARNPQRTFIRIAIAALLLSFLMDIPLFFYDITFFAGATAGGIWALMSMHVVIAAVIVPALVRFARPAPERSSERLSL